MKKFAITILLTGSTLLMAVNGKLAYRECIGCHGENGEKSALNKSAIITGQNTALTVKQLNGYKAGILNKAGMGGLMKDKVASMDDATIKAVADYIATMK